MPGKRSFKEVCILRLDPGERSKNLGEMLSHLLFRLVSVIGVDGRRNGAVLVDEFEHGSCARERQLAETVHMRLQIAHSFPGERKPAPSASAIWKSSS